MFSRKASLFLYVLVLILGTVFCANETTNAELIKKKMEEEKALQKAAAEKRAAEDALRKKAAEMQLQLEKDHENDPGDKNEFAASMLRQAFKMGNNGSDKAISVTQLINKYLRASSGDARVQMLKVLKIMDRDMNYYITIDEFSQTMGPVIANPDRALSLSFQLYDQNGNGVLTKYEWAIANMLMNEKDVTVMDLWRDASQEFHFRDQNLDGLVDEAEYAMYDLYEIAYSIGKAIEDRDNSDPFNRKK